MKASDTPITNMVTKKKREPWLDTLRGFAIILVVLGHIANGNLKAGTWGKDDPLLFCIYNFTYAFHMPLMFVLSGYAFSMAYAGKKHPDYNGIKKQILNFLWNYLVWSVFTIVTKTLFSSVVAEKQNYGNILKIWYKAVDAYWYLYVLVFLYLIGTVICLKKRLFVPVLVISAVSCLCYPLLKFIPNTWTIKLVLLYLFFFVLGMYLQTHRQSNNQMDTPKNIPHIGDKTHLSPKKLRDIFRSGFCGLAGFSYLAYVLYLALTGTRLYGNLYLPVISALGSFGISVFLIETALMIFKKAGLFSLIGQYSLEIYLTHTFITTANRLLLPKLGINTPLLHVTISCLMGTLLPMGCAWMLKKIGLHGVIFKPCEVWKRRLQRNNSST